jgi:hypothetical protein
LTRDQDLLLAAVSAGLWLALLVALVACQGDGLPMGASQSSSPIAVPGASRGHPVPDLSPPAGYRLHFSDEFNYTGPPDPVRWGVETGATAGPNYATVDGSKLILRATRTGATRLSSSVRQSDSRYITSWRGTIGIRNEFPAPGWLAIKMKPSTVRGAISEVVLWSSWYAYPDGWPYGANPKQGHYAELDIVEARGFQPNIVDVSTHAWMHPDFAPTGATNLNQHVSTAVTAGQSLQYVAMWDRNYVRIYIDGRLVHSRDMTNDPFPVFGQQMVLVMGCWVGRDGDGWAGAGGVDDPIDTQMEVDYVRFYTQGHWPGDPSYRYGDD